MDDKVLLGGLKVDDAVRQAREWWETKGRYLIQDTVTQVMDVRAWYSPSAAGYIRRDRYRDNEAGGILNCLPWDDLSRAEKLDIVKQWHWCVWLPMYRPDLCPAAKRPWDELPKAPAPASKAN